MNRPPLPSPQDQVRLLGMIPDDRAGIPEAEVFDLALEAGLDAYVAPEGRMFGDLPFSSALRLLRRNGWAVFSKHANPPVWSRTPSGAAHYATNHRQEATTP